MDSKQTVNENLKAAAEAVLSNLWQAGELPCPYQVINDGRVFVNVEGTDAQKQVFENWLQNLAHVPCYTVNPRSAAALDNEPIAPSAEQFGGRPVRVDLFTEDAFQAVVGDAFDDADSKFEADIHEGQTEISQTFTGQAVKTLFYERYSPGILLKTMLKALVTLNGKQSNDSGKSQGISFPARQDCDQKFYGQDFPIEGVDFNFHNVMDGIRRGDHWFEFDAVSGLVHVEVVRSLVKDDERNGEV